MKNTAARKAEKLDQLVKEARKLILTRYEAAERFTLETLALDLKCKKSMARDLVKVFKAQGLVTVEGRGHIVKAMEGDVLNRTIALRLAIEEFQVGWLVHKRQIDKRSVDFAPLEEIHGRMKKRADRIAKQFSWEEAYAFLELDWEFHLMIATVARLPESRAILQTVLESLYGCFLSPLTFPTTYASAVAEHEAVLACLKNPRSSAEKAGEAIKKHIVESCNRYHDIRNRLPFRNPKSQDNSGRRTPGS